MSKGKRFRTFGPIYCMVYLSTQIQIFSLIQSSKYTPSLVKIYLCKYLFKPSQILYSSLTHLSIIVSFTWNSDIRIEQFFIFFKKRPSH